MVVLVRNILCLIDVFKFNVILCKYKFYFLKFESWCFINKLLFFLVMFVIVFFYILYFV